MAELLIALLLLLLVTSLVASIFPMAREAYTKVVDRANAEVLASTTLTLMRSELDLATDVKVDSWPDDGAARVVLYRSGETGNWRALKNDAELTAAESDAAEEGEGEEESGASSGSALPARGICLLQYLGDGSNIDQNSFTLRELVTQKASAGLYTTCEAIYYDRDTHIFTISNLEVRKRGGASGVVYASVEAYEVRAYNIREDADQAGGGN